MGFNCFWAPHSPGCLLGMLHKDDLHPLPVIDGELGNGDPRLVDAILLIATIQGSNNAIKETAMNR